MHNAISGRPNLTVGTFAKIMNLPLRIRSLSELKPAWRQVGLVIVYNSQLNQFLFTRPKAALAAGEFNANPVQGEIRNTELPKIFCSRILAEQVDHQVHRSKFRYLGSELQQTPAGRKKSNQWSHQLFHVFFHDTHRTDFSPIGDSVGSTEWQGAQDVPNTVLPFLSDSKRSVVEHAINQALKEKLLPYHCQAVLAA